MGQGVTKPVRQAADAAMDLAHTIENPAPWDREAPMTRLLYTDGAVNGKARFHVIDPWHTIHLGTGKAWVGCGLNLLLPLVGRSNVDERVMVIESDYFDFCRRMQLDPILSKIDILTFGGTTDPTGTWSKAGVTTNFMLFLQDFCERHAEKVQEDERLRVFALHKFTLCVCFTQVVSRYFGQV